MEKTFNVAGYSTLLGQRKMRVAKDMKRVMVLERCGHKDVVMYELPYAMTREQASEWLAGGRQTVAAAIAAVELTFEEALSRVALRNERGHFIKKEVREQMARDMMQAA
jgi:truncated hemoglobin YjbI